MRTARFLREYFRASPGTGAEETEVPAPGGAVPATLYRRRGDGRGPGWVVLHGITVPGRRHDALQRFARAVAGSGATVLVPEIPPWSRLRLDPEIADTLISASAEHLARHPQVRGGGVGVVGFSFGATQALATAGRRDLGGAIDAVVSFGAFCDPERTFRFAFTGEYDWRGREFWLNPDPYGRWIISANYLTAAPEYAHMSAVAEAAHDLAAEVGTRGAYAGDPIYDDLKRSVRERLSADEREVWDLIAPAADQVVERDAARQIADRMVAALRRTQPELDPQPVLEQVRGRVVLAHGRTDLLIPYTESLRLAERLSRANVFLRITRLFSHSGGAGGVGPLSLPREILRYLQLLNRALGAL